jgi:hypothetical protein
VDDLEADNQAQAAWLSALNDEVTELQEWARNVGYKS